MLHCSDTPMLPWRGITAPFRWRSKGATIPIRQRYLFTAELIMASPKAGVLRLRFVGPRLAFTNWLGPTTCRIHVLTEYEDGKLRVIALPSRTRRFQAGMFPAKAFLLNWIPIQYWILRHSAKLARAQIFGHVDAAVMRNPVARASEISVRSIAVCKMET